MKRPYTTRDPSLDEGLLALINARGPSPDADLLHQLLVTVFRLREEGTPRGDLKLLNSALKELRYAFKVFRPYAGVRKVTVFGSARTAPEDPATRMARAFASELVRRGFMVITGAGEGVMGAAQRGAGRDRSFGINIRLPFEQVPNDEIRADRKLVTFKYFFTRKLMFVKEADAIALFPGGFGTLDEGFEVLTLLQTGKTNPVPLVLLQPPGDGYWTEWKRHLEQQLAARGLIDRGDLGLFRIHESAESAVEEVVRFYGVYHSCRFVEKTLVLRLHAPLPGETVERLNREFADILTGPIVQGGPLPGEGNPTDLPDLIRLSVPFDRRQHGRLRHLIDAVNAAPVPRNAHPSVRDAAVPSPPSA
ncbi:MAG TPA: LOG family protein [Planctomycetota bacterium]|nr:LOG family protein [Planctomycetota bacterium]